MTEYTAIPEELRRDLLRYLMATSAERARLVGELALRNPSMAELLIDLEADDDLRACFEIELPRRGVDPTGLQSGLASPG